jgi:preprotein translocase subunit SecY
MSQVKNNNFYFSGRNEKLNKPTKKILITFFLLFFFKFGTTIPLSGIDTEALKKSFFEFETANNSIVQILNMYSGSGGKTLLSPFSLGIIPFINASIIIDLLTALFSDLEKLQADEIGKRQLNFYKKIATLILSIIQSFFLIATLKPYFYFNDFFNLSLIGLELVTGSLIVIWLTNIIDKQGIGNGTSLLIFTNIMTNLVQRSEKMHLEILDVFFLIFLISLICISQIGRITLPIVSARQLAFLETNMKNRVSNQLEVQNSKLLIRFTQAGIFPIIIASNLLPFFSYFFKSSGNLNFWIRFFYYASIILFNYFYTSVFWDPEKISEQLRKASVAIVNVTPGRQTISYLENIVRFSSILGGIFLCLILYIYDILKELISSSFFNQVNISSLIILVGIIYELQKTIRGMYLVILIQKNQKKV